MHNKKLAEKMADLCEQAGCKDKIAKIHFEQALRDWHSHPPKDFENWWASQPRQEIDAKVGYNCQIYRDEYLESKQVGLA